MDMARAGTQVVRVPHARRRRCGGRPESPPSFVLGVHLARPLEPKGPTVHISRSHLVKLLGCAATVVALSGCSLESLVSFDGNPRLCARKPPTESVTNELVIVRVVENAGARLVLDRVRYLAPGDDRYINRVIFATTEKVRPAVEGLGGVQRGDSLRVSTTYTSTVRGGGYEAYISNWAANEGECWDGGWVSQHTLEAVARPAD
jgi:hypothetical protein